MTAQVLKVVDWQEPGKGDGSVFGLRPLIPTGLYQLAYLGYSTMYFVRQPKVVMRFRVLNHGPYFGVELERFYNVMRLIGKPGKNGNFKARASSDLVLDFCTVTVGRVSRLDRLPLTKMSNLILIGQVRTVAKNHSQRDLPELLKYSVVANLVGVES